jgi:aminoglycoside phosphotransferase (APT) family kinase protein
VTDSDSRVTDSTVAEPFVVVPAGIPPAEVDIDEALVRSLLRAQHPDLADLPTTLVATGWDNATYRLGEHLAVRLPRIEAAVGLLRNEQTWLPRLAPDLPVPVPAPVRVGEPGPDFPWPWSVVPWVAGRSGEHESLAPDQATAFGRFLAAVHRPAPDGFPRNDYRGVPLAQVTERVEERFRQLSTRDAAPSEPVRERWRSALAAPMDAPDTCVHGDLHPKNIVVDSGRLAAVLDWGDMTAGDRAVDLGAAWMLFPPDAHDRLWRSYGQVSAPTMRRAIGWAVFFGVTLLDVGLENDPPFAEIGRRTLARIEAT